MHQRQKIRQALYDILYECDELRELFDARGRAVPGVNVPFSNIMIGKEYAAEYSDGFQQKRILPIYINIYVKQGDKSPNALDTIAESIESLLALDVTLKDTCENMEYKGADPDYQSGAEQGAAHLMLEYEVTYVWEPALDLTALKEVMIDIDMASPRNDPQTPPAPDGQIDASTLIEDLDQ